MKHHNTTYIMLLIVVFNMHCSFGNDKNDMLQESLSKDVLKEMELVREEIQSVREITKLPDSALSRIKSHVNPHNATKALNIFIVPNDLLHQRNHQVLYSLAYNYEEIYEPVSFDTYFNLWKTMGTKDERTQKLIAPFIWGLTSGSNSQKNDKLIDLLASLLPLRDRSATAAVLMAVHKNLGKHKAIDLLEIITQKNEINPEEREFYKAALEQMKNPDKYPGVFYIE